MQGTKDIDISIVFNNAGYIVTGFFDQTSLDSQLANLVGLAECISTSNNQSYNSLLIGMQLDCMC